MKELFNGMGVALVTPFKDGVVNEEALRKLVEWHIEAGSDALILTGTTGESATLSHKEKLDVYRIGVEQAAGRIQIIAGTGSNDTSASIEISREAEALGVDGLLLVVPAYNKPSQRGLIAHYSAIANAVAIPCILYNVPGRSALDMAPETVIELSRVPNILALKEASGDVPRIGRILKEAQKGFKVYAGNDGEIYDVLALGGHGVISVLGNLCPAETKAMTRDYWAGETEKVRDAQEYFNPLIDALFIETNPCPVKEAMNLMGLEVGDLRLPLVGLSEENHGTLIQVLNDYGLVK